MSSSRSMPKVNFQGDEKLKTAYIYSKFIEEKNSQRALIAKKALRTKRMMFGGCMAVVFGIYGYTISQISQENFLDDFDEPPRIIKS